MALRIQATVQFTRWLDGLADLSGRGRVQARIECLAAGNPGVQRTLKRGLNELKIDVGPGYRVYYVLSGQDGLILLCGGDKSTQKKDIEQAYKLLRLMKK